MIFTARTIRGSGRGKDLGTPTINLNLDDVPTDFEEGIYACFATFDNSQRLPAALHYGPRPVFKDAVACEVHLIDQNIDAPPPSVTVDVVQRIRDVRDFSSPEALQEQMTQDIADARGILSAS